MKGVKQILILFFTSISLLQGQTILEHDYYLSNLNSFNFYAKDLASDLNLPNHWADQQLHFRWNGHLYHKNSLSAKISIRNRIFTGYQWQENLFNFRNALDVDHLNFISINEDKIGIHHHIDRFYAQWEKGNWNVRIGRQRINWGIQNYWNSHDLFNQTNFFDFDYIERPGADALRIQYYTKLNNSFELALNNDIQAVLYKFNLHNYDIQLLSAKYYEDYSLGLGWAGQIKDAGFKGEFTYFKNTENEEDLLVGSVSLDYSFKNGVYLTAGCLYRNPVEMSNPLGIYGMELSAKSPMPFEYNFLYQINYQIHPLIQIGTSFIHDGSLDFVFLSPQVSYSVSESLDLMLSSQNMWVNLVEELEAINQSVYTRLQWNF